MVAPRELVLEEAEEGLCRLEGEEAVEGEGEASGEDVTDGVFLAEGRSKHRPSPVSGAL